MKSLVLSLFCLFLFLFQVTYGQEISYGNNPVASHSYQVRGIRIYTEQYGKGKPLLLLHGNGGSIASMAKIIPYFSEKYRVIAMDSRAHGKSTDPNDSLSFEMMADDVSTLLDSMHIDSTYIIGWSDGGIIGIEMALRHSEQVIKLASSGANIVPDSSAFIPSVWQETKDDYAAQKATPKTTEKEKRNWKYFLLDYLHPHIAFSELHRINKPVLVISGDHDLISLEHTLKIFQNIPKAELWIVPNSGHGTLITHTADFCKTVDTFFEKN